MVFLRYFCDYFRYTFALKCTSETAVEVELLLNKVGEETNGPHSALKPRKEWDVSLKHHLACIFENAGRLSIVDVWEKIVLSMH